MPLEYIVKQPKTTAKNPPLLILLHGYGSNEQDLFSFASELPDDLLIISAQAPLSLGSGSYAWYTINFEGAASNRSNLVEAEESLLEIETFIDVIIKKYNANTNKLFLLGFSQGCILSMAYAFRNPNKIKNIIALSGYINTDLLPHDYRINNYKNLDFFISHGSVDQVLPVEWARKSPILLDELNIKNQYQEYPVGHGVAPQNFTDFKNWIIKRL
ncbi:MAG: alpha/beta fold hydrolase [Flavobacteriaceae bacterium]|nr:alpha/beta fold hydrolase [Flavobacteriaceae bacterium]